MEFRTPISIHPSSVRIDHKTEILTIGSCFANVMGERLKINKFKVEVNPFGVIFNPLSIFKVLEASAKGEDLLKDSYLQHNNLWYNYDLHSDYSAFSKEELQLMVSETISKIHVFIKSSNIITLTFGTAFIYRLINTKEPVANCHKVRSQNFSKELLSSSEISDSFDRLYSIIKEINPAIQIVLTVSPVRHIKDGIEQNSISKSILRTACYNIQKNHPEIDYFPAYEIMMDDLRDYRFYKEDMIHPSALAENYIWEKFIEQYFEKDSKEFLKEWESILRAIEHKPFHPESEGHQKFLKETITKLRKLSAVVNVEKEIIDLERKLK